MKRVWWSLVFGLAATVAGAQVVAVPQLDFAKFTGTWYEIARIPVKREKACVADTLLMFTTSVKARRFDVVRSCTTKDDTPDAANLYGKMEGKGGDGKLKVGPFWPFYSRFWVLAVGRDYDWVLVGDPKKKGLWVLSRKTTLGDAEMAEAKAKARAEGYDVGKLAEVKQGQ
jgi:apolipoprotein D and lipocalin family protein